ncbi:MAG: hypothetical protein ACLTGT_06925 [Oscillospiraceae bacterium]
MTLQEMSHDYAASADAIGERIRQLHQRALTAQDPEEVLCLQRRIRELMPLRRQARELAYHTAHYYDRVPPLCGIPYLTAPAAMTRWISPACSCGSRDSRRTTASRSGVCW